MNFPTPFLTRPQHETLRRLIIMRVVVLIAQGVAVAIAKPWFGIDLPIFPLLAIMLALMLVSGLTRWRVRRGRLVSHAELFLQLGTDIIALTSFLYFSGGATNPFVSFYLPTLAVAAAILPWRFSLALALLSLCCYSAMTSMYVPLRVNDPDQAIAYHLAGMWVNFALSAALITWFVARMSRALRERDAELAQARERHLQNERIVALATQAASTAHEIGTPLSTVAIIAGELKLEAGGNSALAPYLEDLETIESQIALCKATLDRMSTRASPTPETTTTSERLDEWLKRCIDAWRLRYPSARLKLSLPPCGMRLPDTHTFSGILMTLLDNAAQAAPGVSISIALDARPGAASIRVEDDGPGIAPRLSDRLGHAPVPSTTGGRGIGLMLAFAAARQAGASITLAPGAIQGTIATLTIPAT